MPANFFFFRHRFKSSTWVLTPGRYLFSIRGRSLVLTGDRFTPDKERSLRVYVDGFGADRPGPNVDPNVLACALPWFLSYCRATANVQLLGPMAVRPSRSRHLAACVSKGDVVIFGQPISTSAVAIDTVLCVGDVVRLPTARKLGKSYPFAVEKRFSRYWAECRKRGLARRTLAWNAFVRTPDFVLNLVDSLTSKRAAEVLGHRRQTKHSRSYAARPWQIVGTRHVPSRALYPSKLVIQFAAGRGFNFIPIGTPIEWKKAALARSRPGVFITYFADAKRLDGDRDHSIFQLSQAEGRVLVAAIFCQAKRLIYGSLLWDAPRRFSRFSGARQPVYLRKVPKGWKV